MTSNGSNGRRLSISRIASAFMDSPFNEDEQSATRELYHGRQRREKAEYRVNGTVRNVPAFYAAFGVKEGDKMYLPPEKRVKIW